MRSRGEVQMDPGRLGLDAFSGPLELVVPYTDPVLAREALRRAAALTAGPGSAHAAAGGARGTVSRRLPLSGHRPTLFWWSNWPRWRSECPLPVTPQVVLARSREDGLRFALNPGSTVLVGTRKRLWRTSEERLARMLAADGHKVVLVHVG